MLGTIAGVALFLGGMAALTPRDRRHCFEGYATMCRPGEGGTIEYGGIAGFSSCTLRCGGEDGEIVRIDRSFLASLSFVLDDQRGTTR